VVPKVMGSASTYLQQGDTKAAPYVQGIRYIRFHLLTWPRGLVGVNGEEGPVAVANWCVSLDVLPNYHARPTIRVVGGNQKELFSVQSVTDFQTSSLTVTAQSDRMGYRLQGPRLELREPHELISEAVTTGTIQVPTEGNPIVLMADHQTTGGYPQIAQVASADISVLA
jgi:antagonist of KipI